MKPVSIAILVVSSSFLAFYAGRVSVGCSARSGCGTHAAVPQPMPMSMPPAPPSQLPAMPTMPSHEAHAPAVVSGRIAEIIQVPNYTYLHLTTQAGDTWAAVAATTTLKKGATVTLANAMPMSDFTSPTLKRTFATIYFAELAH
ncbi:MAG: hypothetical protein ABI321_23545 [Polyangia bacterium]